MTGFSNRPRNRNAAGYSGLQGSGGARFPQMNGQMIKEFVGEFSSHIKYWKAMQCPCMNATTGQPKLNCNVCRGLGWAYLDSERDPKFQKAQVHSRKSQRINEAGGLMTTGYSSITFMPGVIPAEGDLVQVLRDREVVNDEYNFVGAKLTDGSSGETLRFRDVDKIERVLVWNAAKTNIQEVPPDKWKFDPQARQIIFTPPLSDGTEYSLRYIASPEYIVRSETAKPLLRVGHDDNFQDPYASGGKSGIDMVYPFNCQMVRLDRAILQRQRGAIDLTTQSTFNNKQGRGPFR